MNILQRSSSFLLALSLCAATAHALQTREAPGARPAAQPGGQAGANPGAQAGEHAGGRLRVSGPSANSPSYDYVKKVGVVGASVSAGFGLDYAPRRKPQQAGEAAAADAAKASRATARNWTALIDDSIVVEHQTVQYASSMAFADPAKNIGEQIVKANAEGSTSIVAIDGLFWFAYGQRPDEERSAYFERGLSLYADVKVPLLLGDIPAMQEGPMLRASMIPTGVLLAALNKRLAEWAKDRPNVAIVPLAKAAAAMQSGEDVVAWGHVFPTKGAAPVLQADKLHTTYEGNLAIWSMTLDSWATLRPLGEPLPFQNSPMQMQMARNFRHGTNDEVRLYAVTKDYPADAIWRGRGPAHNAAGPEARPREGERREGRGEVGTPTGGKPVERKPLERRPGG